jgi:3-dehydroquinate synthase
MGAAAMKRLEVTLGANSYPVVIGKEVLTEGRELLAGHARGGRLVVVTDTNVWAALGAQFQHALQEIQVEAIVIRAGEASKSWSELEQLIDRLIRLRVERGDTLIAFGGGMVGDLTGFAAAILKRGCDYVQVPTTLLAQVDSSVGGKTAINTAGGKNLVGAFHQPKAVLIDPATLNTLPLRELRAGYAEIVKYGLIGDPGFFDWCERNGAALIAGDVPARLHAIETCIRAKAAIVAEDERETSGRRALLNFGHTFGHALEAEAGYSGDLLHGEAVALGMVLAMRFSAERGQCHAENAARVERHLAQIGLPTEIQVNTGKRLVAHMRHDKKAAGGRSTFVLSRGIGRAFLEPDVDLTEVEVFLDRHSRR